MPRPRGSGRGWRGGDGERRGQATQVLGRCVHWEAAGGPRKVFRYRERATRSRLAFETSLWQLPGEQDAGWHQDLCGSLPPRKTLKVVFHGGIGVQTDIIQGGCVMI